MTAITIPTTDVNSESAIVVRWHADDRTTVCAGDAIVEVETSKAILDVQAPRDGLLLHLLDAGEQLKLGDPLGYVFDSIERLEAFALQRAAAAVAPVEHAGRITEPARRRAAELGVDIDQVAHSSPGLITTKLVDAFAAAQIADGSGPELPGPLAADPGVTRLVLIGAGMGATQVLDILAHDAGQQAVAIVDDDRSHFGNFVDGVPVVGGFERARALFSDGELDAAIITISTSVPARTRLRTLCAQAGIPLANAIDPTARVTRGVTMGTGNVICAHCHFGVETVIGDNNFISAYNSFDHHNTLGDDISTGPGVMTSGLVEIGDRCRFGTGVFVEPHVHIGAGCQIASGAVIVGSVPAEHAVKTKVITTTVVPLRRP